MDGRLNVTVQCETSSPRNTSRLIDEIPFPYSPYNGIGIALQVIGELANGAGCFGEVLECNIEPVMGASGVRFVCNVAAARRYVSKVEGGLIRRFFQMREQRATTIVNVFDQIPDGLHRASQISCGGALKRCHRSLQLGELITFDEAFAAAEESAQGTRHNPKLGISPMPPLIRITASYAVGSAETALLARYRAASRPALDASISKRIRVLSQYMYAGDGDEGPRVDGPDIHARWLRARRCARRSQCPAKTHWMVGG